MNKVISQSIDTPSVSTTSVAEQATPLVRFGLQVAPHSPWLVLASGVGAEVVISGTQCTVPNAAPWLKGLVNQGGNIYPIFDMGKWLGLPEDGVARRIVLIGRGQTGAAILCINEPRLMSLTTSTSLALPAIYSELNTFVTGFGNADLGLGVEFDFVKWFQNAGRLIKSVAA